MRKENFNIPQWQEYFKGKSPEEIEKIKKLLEELWDKYPMKRSIKTEGIKTPPSCFLALRASVSRLTVSATVLCGAPYSSHQHPYPAQGEKGKKGGIIPRQTFGLPPLL